MSEDFYKGFDEQVLTVRTLPNGLERQIMSQLENFLRDHHNPIVSQLNAEIERLKRLAQSESDAKEMADGE